MVWITHTERDKARKEGIKSRVNREGRKTKDIRNTLSYTFFFLNTALEKDEMGTRRGKLEIPT